MFVDDVSCLHPARSVSLAYPGWLAGLTARRAGGLEGWRAGLFYISLGIHCFTVIGLMSIPDQILRKPRNKRILAWPAGSRADGLSTLHLGLSGDYQELLGIQMN